MDNESEPRARNWGVTIAWSHPLLAQLLPEDLYARLPECQPDPDLDTKAAGFESVIIRDGQTGITLVEPPFPGVRRLNIQKTRAVWSKGLNVKVSLLEPTNRDLSLFFKVRQDGYRHQTHLRRHNRSLPRRHIGNRLRRDWL